MFVCSVVDYGPLLVLKGRRLRSILNISLNKSVWGLENGPSAGDMHLWVSGAIFAITVEKSKLDRHLLSSLSRFNRLELSFAQIFACQHSTLITSAPQTNPPGKKLSRPFKPTWPRTVLSPTLSSSKSGRASSSVCSTNSYSFIP